LVRETAANKNRSHSRRHPPCRMKVLEAMMVRRERRRKRGIS
jgi:hypothetical protein